MTLPVTLALMVWAFALGRAIWRAVASHRAPGTRRVRFGLRTSASGTHSVRLARRLLVACECSTSLARALATVILFEPEGAMRRALQLRLRHLQRRQSSRQPPGQLPRWQALGQPCPAALRVLDALLADRCTREQALACWRIELICSRAVSCRVR